MKYSQNHIEEKILKATADFDIRADYSKSEAWKAVENRIYKKEKGNLILMGSMLRYAIAASVTILLLVGFSLLNIREISTGNGETLLVELPDESMVTLNASSSISYNPWFWHFNREVELQGEAFFEVEKGAEFKVWSGEKSVTVLGTSFNIKSRDDIYQVSCFTGKVRVKNDVDREVILTPGEETIDRGLELPRIGFEKSKTATWRTGDFYFESTSLVDVIRELERQFDIEVIFSPESNRIYTGYFNTHSLEEALDMVFTPMGFTYKIEKNKTVLIESL